MTVSCRRSAASTRGAATLAADPGATPPSGSTELSARLDPEDLREVISAYHRAVAEIVAGFDGFVAKYMGDGVLVYFGYPRAQNDDRRTRAQTAHRTLALCH